MIIDCIIEKVSIHLVNLIIKQYQLQLMNNEANLEQASGQFEQLREEVLTYSLSQQIPTSPVNKSRKNARSKNEEKHKLQLIIRDNIQTFKEFDFKTANQNIKKIESGRGKIIPIGSVIFKSNFECGNIWSAMQVSPNTFQIYLEKETNSNRRSAWFYFSVEGIKGEAHFIIKGFTKSSSLYNEGMKVCYRDTKQLSKWRRGGTRISYTVSDEEESQQIIQKKQRNTYELRFSYFFKNNQHTCIQFAYCFPYGLKKLYNMISHFKDQLIYQPLTKSFGNLDIPLLTIGNKDSQEVIILSARVHPGETVSSFIMQGFLKELLGDNQFAKMLKANYLFKIVPMLNPDGVMRGNYRFSACGCDLNRKWKTCRQNAQPQIYYMKQLIRKTNKEKKVIMYIDFHGHSRKKNVFFYGCCEKDENNNIINPKAKEFPFLMQKISDAFRYQNCCFNVQKDKDGTARITVWKQLKIDYVYTLQSSFCGPQFGVNYLQNDYEKIGKKLCQGIAVFFYSNLQKSKGHEYKTLQKLAIMKQKVIAELMGNSSLLHIGDEDDSGSQSEPQVGQIAEKDRNPENGVPKPQAINIEAKIQVKTKHMNNPSKQFYSQSLISEKKNEKLKSQCAQFDEIKNVKILSEKINKKKEEEALKNSFAIIDTSKFDRVQIKFANTLNTFELQSLRASSLYQKNVRVHSFTKNKERFTSNSKRVVNPFCEEVKQIKQEKERLKINLMHDRQGVQYRRVRKLAEQNQKKLMVISDMDSKVVKQLAGNQMFMGQTQRPNKINTIAPRFFPASQQKNRRTSIDIFIKQLSKKNEIKKVNGDEVHGRSIGKQVFI